MDEYLKTCRYCKHNTEGKCLKLLQMMTAGSIDVMLDSYLCNSDFRTIAEEHLPYVSKEPEIIRGSLDSTLPKISKRRADDLERFTREMFEVYRQKCINSAVEVADEVVVGINYYLQKNMNSNSVVNTGVEVDDDFYCKFWE